MDFTPTYHASVASETCLSTLYLVGMLFVPHVCVILGAKHQRQPFLSNIARYTQILFGEAVFLYH